MLTGFNATWLQVFNMQAPQQVFKDIESPLKYQTRCITCFPDSTGYMVGAAAKVTAESDRAWQRSG